MIATNVGGARQRSAQDKLDQPPVLLSAAGQRSAQGQLDQETALLLAAARKPSV
jgi:hypothetical protein